LKFRNSEFDWRIVNIKMALKATNPKHWLNLV